MVSTRRRAQPEEPSGEAAAPVKAPPSKKQQEPSQLLQQYRKEWQTRKSIGSLFLSKSWEVLYWLECISGLSMFDTEEKLIISLIYIALMALIGLGAYKQSVTLWNMMIDPSPK